MLVSSGSLTPSSPDAGHKDSRFEPPATSVDALFATVYDRLKTLAHRELHKSNGGTLNATRLVHEVYLKMCSNSELSFPELVKFFSYAAISMRHIIVKHATRRMRPKLGGDQMQVTLGDADAQNVCANPQLALQLDAALSALEKNDPRAARVVELHYFAGVSLEQVSELLGVAKRTVDRDWRYAKAYLSGQVAESNM
jgi:RNA polymerase sigma factor (TIGR02999 family)